VPNGALKLTLKGVSSLKLTVKGASSYTQL
jgi:hypothetical protein